MQKNIVLVGFMGAGKTAVGQALSARLKRELVDLDGLIADSEGRPITRIAYVQELEKLAKEKEDAAGYQRVRTPHIAKEIKTLEFCI